jgi:hypothetical protein
MRIQMYIDGDLFKGEGYVAELDDSRLLKQQTKIFNYIKDGGWYTLRSISEATNAPEASASAQLRSFRKPIHGGHTVYRRRVPNGNGLHEYRLELNHAEINLTGGDH